MGDAQHWKAHLLVQRDSSSSAVAKTWSEDAPGSPPAPCQPQSRVEPTPSPSGDLSGGSSRQSEDEYGGALAPRGLCMVTKSPRLGHGQRRAPAHHCPAPRHE